MAGPMFIWGLLCATIGIGCEADIEPEAELRADQAEAIEAIALDRGPDGAITLPSGLVVTQQELRLEPVGVQMLSVTTVRLRYVAAQLADTQAFPFERVEPGFGQLCAGFGLEAVATSAPNAEQIIISISSAPTAFGETAPEVVQFFDSFRVEDGRCIWEGI